MLDVSKIVKVYNGKIGCMCGCNGKYSYNPDLVELGTKMRGYPVNEDEVSLRSVKIIAKKVLTNPNRRVQDNMVFVEDPSAGYAGRIQMVVFAKEEVDA